MRFENRSVAASLLATRLDGYRGRNPLVLGIPRGAVPMARQIADALQGDVDVVLVHKLRAPGRPELAIGAIDESGHVSLSSYAAAVGASDRYMENEEAEQLATIRRRRAEYTPYHPPVDPAGRIVIVVDDGIATGSTMLAAIRALRAKKPARIVVATAVAPADTVASIALEADEVVCLFTPEAFFAIGEFFDDFGQVSDAEVIEALKTPSRAAAPVRSR